MSNIANVKPNGCTNQSINNGIASKPQSGIDVQIVRSESEFDALQPDWDHLHEKGSFSSLFNSWYWNRLWWKHYGQKGALFILVARADEQVVAIAPLYQCRSRAAKIISVDTIRFIGSGGDTSPDDLDTLCHPDFETIAVQAICNALLDVAHIKRIQLSDIDQNSPLVSALLNIATAKGWSAPLQLQQQRLVDVLPDTIAEFEQKLSRNARKQRKRRRAKFDKAGKVSYEFCSTDEEVDIAFQALINLHQLRLASKSEAGSFQSENYRGFHLAVMKEALKRNELKLLALKLDDIIIGVEYAFVCQRKLCFFQTGFDPQHQHLSPGHLLMMQTIDEAINDGANKIDLLKGDYPYKTTYAKQNKTTVNLDFWKSAMTRGVVQLLRAIRSN